MNNVNDRQRPGVGSEWMPAITKGLGTTRQGGMDYLINDRRHRFKLEGEATVNHTDVRNEERTVSLSYLPGGDVYGRNHVQPPWLQRQCDELRQFGMEHPLDQEVHERQAQSDAGRLRRIEQPVEHQPLSQCTRAHRNLIYVCPALRNATHGLQTEQCPR